jgi:predicted anti-sigma-YlaC factor YlaD
MTMDHEHHAEETTQHVYDRRAWSPAQIVAGVAGFALVVIGGIALARLGFAGSITGETTSVAGFEATRLWAIVEIVLGVILLGTAASPYRVRGGLTTLGILLAAFGVIVAVEPDAFTEALGTDQTSGILWLIVGVVLVAAAWMSPTIVSQRRHSELRHEEGDSGAV